MLSEIPGTGFVRVMFEQGCKVEKGEHHMMPVDSIPWFLDWLAAVEAAVRAEGQWNLERAIQIAQEANDDCRIWAAKLAAAQAVIAGALELYKPTPELGIGRSRWRTADEFLVAIRNALSQSPTDALQAHDRQVAEKAWDEGARWAAVECGAIDRVENAWIAEGDNPYRGTPEQEGKS